MTSGDWQGGQPGTSPPPIPSGTPHAGPPTFAGGSVPPSPVQYSEPVFPAPVFPGQPVAVPHDRRVPAPLPPPPSRNKPLIILAAAVVALLGVGGIAFAVASGGDDSATSASGTRSAKALAAGGNPISPCASAPTMDVTGFRKEGGQLIASVEVNGGCTDGDILSSSATRIAISQSGSNVAAAMFDFSTPAVLLPGSGDAPVNLELCFNAPDYWRLPDTLTAGSARVLVEKIGPSNGPDQADPGDIIDDLGRRCPSGGAAPQSGDADSSSHDGLEEMRATDVGRIRALGDVWVPQVSTKRPGLDYDGIIWNYPQILGEQYYFRERYPETALLWTGDFRSYNDPNWWGSIVLKPFSNPQGALAWCAGQGLDKDHCFAKRVNAPGTQGSNEYQR